MTEKEFRKLSKAQYLEMMVEQGREIKRLKEELELAREEIKEKEIKIQKAGSIAEAALSLNDVFGAAQRAADQYLESIRAQKQIYDEKVQASEQAVLEQAELANKYFEETKAKCEQMERETQERCRKLEEQTKQKCRALLHEA